MSLRPGAASRSAGAVAGIFRLGNLDIASKTYDVVKDGTMRTLDRLTSEALPYAMHKPVVTCSPDVLGGTPVFAGTRVPVQTLIDYWEGGETINDFLEGFPTVSREQVVAFLEEARDKMVAGAS